MDIDSIKELAKTVVENLNLKDYKGDIVALKVVENEFGNIEAGGIGVQNTIAKGIPLTVSDKDIKAAIEALLKEKDDIDKLLFRNKKQWWAVYRVLSTFCQYPKQMNSFKTKITNMEIDYGGNPNVMTYDSLAAAPKDVPLMATCSPSTWDTLKDKSDNYKQQYAVAEFLMLKLGIKS
ncbi:MAG: hypothetical protein IJ588_03090 [Prevotella sp.]|nr:hypothetical protein [Prevotella sp.]